MWYGLFCVQTIHDLTHKTYKNVKKIGYLLLFLDLVISSCNSATQSKNTTDSLPATPHIDSSHNRVSIGDNIALNIIGAWIFDGDSTGNASFEIRKNEIYYPEHFKSYKFWVKNDTLIIKYEDYSDTSEIKMPNNDSLTLTGMEEQHYHRVTK